MHRIPEIVLAFLLVSAAFAVLAVLKTAGLVSMFELLSSISWSSVASIIFGAAISAFVSYVLQRNSFAEARKTREAERKEKRQAIAYSLLFKTLRIHSDLVTLEHAVTSTIEDARKNGFAGEHLYQVVRPVIPLPDPVKFSAEEMALLLSLNSDLFNDMAAIDELHKHVITVFDTYKKERTETFEQLQPKMEGVVGTKFLNQQQQDWLAPRAVNLNGYVHTMLHLTGNEGKLVWSYLERLSTLLHDKLDVRHKLERRPSSELSSPSFP